MFSQFDSVEVEDYFNRLNAQLRKMPPEDRRGMHQELRQHVEALAAAHEELGASPGEALRAALDQLGEPKRIGRRLFQEWRKTAFPGERQVLPAVIIVLFIHFMNIYAIASDAWTTSWIPLPIPNWAAGALWWVSAPLAAGIMASSLFQKGGMKGVVIGHLLVPVLMIAPPMVLYQFTTLPQFLIDIQFLLQCSFVYMAVGCASAFLTGLVRQKNLPFARWPRLRNTTK